MSNETGAHDPKLSLIPGIPQNTMTTQEVRSLFDQIDLDGNGCLEEVDIRNMLLMTGQSVSDEVVTEMIRMFDHDGSGLISFDEFSSLCMNPPPLFENTDSAPT